jgi:hypothetical protein
MGSHFFGLYQPFKHYWISKLYLCSLGNYQEGIDQYVQGKPLTYQEAMELEIMRLRLGLSIAQRNSSLISKAQDPASLNPNQLIHLGYAIQVTKKLKIVTKNRKLISANV